MNLKLAGAVLLLTSSPSLTTDCTVNQSRNQPPNIVILLADDLGWSDLSCFGGEAKTPHLDRLAAGGLRLTSFYSAAPNCSPARAGLLTGRQPGKVGIYNYIPKGHPMHLRSEEITLAEILKEAGYYTGHFGKWHLSTLAADEDLGQPQPADQGFDYSLATTNNAMPSHLNPENFVRNGKKTGTIEGYSCHILADELSRWLDHDDARKGPFFAYVAFHEPHKKIASPPVLTAKYDMDPLDAEYLANVENLDLAIGKILAKVETLGKQENTLVLFASDNGSYRNGSNGMLLGGKSFVYEGGIRVPGIISWPNKIAPGQVSNQVSSLVDVMPTICDLVGQGHPNVGELDGISLVPLFSNSPLVREDPLSWFFYRTSPQMAMRFNDQTLLGMSLDTVRHTHPLTAPDMAYIKRLELDSFVLFDLSNDPGQAHPLTIEAHSGGKAMVHSMQHRLRQMQEVAPTWINLPPATSPRKGRTHWRQLHPTGFSN